MYPVFGNSSYAIPALVVPQTNYSKIVPVIVGTNFIRICRNTYEQTLDEDVPDEWRVAFNSLKDEVPVKTTNKYAIQIAPNETKVIRGIVRNVRNIESAVTEQVNTSLSGGLVICPRVISLTKSKNTVTIPVRVCNVSASIVHVPLDHFYVHYMRLRSLIHGTQTLQNRVFAVNLRNLYRTWILRFQRTTLLLHKQVR